MAAHFGETDGKPASQDRMRSERTCRNRLPAGLKRSTSIIAHYGVATLSALTPKQTYRMPSPKNNTLNTSVGDLTLLNLRPLPEWRSNSRIRCLWFWTDGARRGRRLHAWAFSDDAMTQNTLATAHDFSFHAACCAFGADFAPRDLNGSLRHFGRRRSSRPRAKLAVNRPRSVDWQVQ